MAKSIHRLTDLKVKKIIKQGDYNDGGGLYLHVSKNRAKSWFFRYQINGKERRRGLGSYPTISLLNAREKAQVCQMQRSKGVDPIEFAKSEKYNQEKQTMLNESAHKTFKDCASEYIELQKAKWSNEKHVYQWTQSLEHYAFSHFGNTPIQEINVGMIVNALNEIWETKTETATRVRQRIEAIIDYATAMDYRSGENPGRWKGRLDKIFPKPSEFRKVIHHPAMHYEEVSEYFSLLREQSTIPYLALAFIIVTATRSGEARMARWDEFDLKNKIWTLPEHRVKSRREFRIPLSNEAIKILNQARMLEMNGWVFPGQTGQRSISDAAVRVKLKNDYPELTVHGFRSTFRDWCAEETSYPRIVAETALSHVLQDKTEAAYQRSDYLGKRRELMQAWSNYLLKGAHDG